MIILQNIFYRNQFSKITLDTTKIIHVQVKITRKYPAYYISGIKIFQSKNDLAQESLFRMCIYNEKWNAVDIHFQYFRLFPDWGKQEQNFIVISGELNRLMWLCAFILTKLYNISCNFSMNGKCISFTSNKWVLTILLLTFWKGEDLPPLSNNKNVVTLSYGSNHWKQLLSTPLYFQLWRDDHLRYRTLFEENR